MDISKLSTEELLALKKQLQGGQNDDGTFGTPPEGIVLNPKTGQMEDLRSPAHPGIPQGGVVSAGLGAGQGVGFNMLDETVAGLRAATGEGDYDYDLARMREAERRAKEEHPVAYHGSKVGGAVGTAVAAAPLTVSGRLAAGSTLFPRAAAGVADGTVFGGLAGLGEGEGAEDRLAQGGIGAGIGGLIGGVLPVAASGASWLYEFGRNALQARPVAQEVGTSPEALRLFGRVMDADGSLGPAGQANMARAGSEAMLADAGPNARAVLDTAIQRGGPGAVAARQAIGDRTGRSAATINAALDNTLGQPQGVTAARTTIREGSAGARRAGYDAAYARPINYASQEGQALEGLIRTRVPPSVIQHANALMRLNGEKSQQILARVADDGSATFERLPDVRQIDYITRALRDLASSGEGQGALGGQTAIGRAYEGLSREIRDTLKGLVPEYGRALETAADPIRRSQAVELGSKLFSPSMTRDQVREATRGMTNPEREAIAQGVRSQMDDLMANVTRTVQDGDMPAREAIKAIRDLSSRANREKLSEVIGAQRAGALFDQIDRATASFNLRASVADNSKTFARQATEQSIRDVTQPGMIGKAAQGQPINAMRRFAQVLTGMTPEKIRGREDAMYSELARLLTQRGGAGQRIYDAVGKLGATDTDTALMARRIAGLLPAPFSYPATTLGLEYTRRQ